MPAQSSLLDRAIAWLSPGAAVQREQARMQLTVLRAYEAGAHNRRTTGWKAGSGSSSSEVLPSLATVRNRARQMVRDNEYAEAAVRGLATGVVGSTGINVIPALKSERVLWQQWCEVCDADGIDEFPGLQKLGATHWKGDGEVLIRRRWRKVEDGLPVPMQIQLLEPDHLDHTKTGPVDGGYAIAGVQYDLIGRRAGYWLFPEHPGEVASISRSRLQSRFVPASEVTHFFARKRVSQVRGMPQLAASLMRLRDIDGYEEAELVRKKIEACFTAFVTTDQPRLSVGELSKPAGSPTQAPPQESIRPGLIKYLSTGESVTFGSPQASGGYEGYLSHQLHAVAVGAGITYHQLTGDTSKSSYTSHRAALVEYYKLVEADQWLHFIPGFVKPIRRWFREAALLAGKPVGNKPDRITTPRKQMVDPLKDSMADKEEIRAGLKSLSEALRERGYDPEEVLEEIKADRELASRLGLIFDTDATVTDLKLKPTDLLDGGKTTEA